MNCNVNNRNISIDFLRCLSCVAVVIMHATSLFWLSTPVQLLSLSEYNDIISSYISTDNLYEYNSIEFLFCSMVDAITRFSVPCFIMLSGALVLNKTNIGLTYVKRKAIYILKLLLAWCIIITVLSILINHILKLSYNFIDVFRLALDGNGVFWFLYMLLPLYVISPVLKTILNDRESSRIFLFFWIITTILFQSIQVYSPKFGESLKFYYWGQIPIYTGYYFLGGYIYQKKDSFTKWLKKKTLIYAAIIAILCIIIISLGSPCGYFHNFANPFCVIYSTIVFFTIFIYKRHYILDKAATLISQYAMPIFALHIVFLKLISMIIPINYETGGLQIIFYTFFALSSSLISGIILKKVPILNKFLY